MSEEELMQALELLLAQLCRILARQPLWVVQHRIAPPRQHSPVFWQWYVTAVVWYVQLILVHECHAGFVAAAFETQQIRSAARWRRWFCSD